MLNCILRTVSHQTFLPVVRNFDEAGKLVTYFSRKSEHRDRSCARRRSSSTSLGTSHAPNRPKNVSQFFTPHLLNNSITVALQHKYISKSATYEVEKVKKSKVDDLYRGS